MPAAQHDPYQQVEEEVWDPNTYVAEPGVAEEVWAFPGGGAAGTEEVWGYGTSAPNDADAEVSLSDLNAVWAYQAAAAANHASGVQADGEVWDYECATATNKLPVEPAGEQFAEQQQEVAVADTATIQEEEVKEGNYFYVCKRALEGVGLRLRNGETITQDVVDELIHVENLAAEELMVCVDMNGAGGDYEGAEQMVVQLGPHKSAAAFVQAFWHFEKNKDKLPEDDRPKPMTVGEWRSILEKGKAMQCNGWDSDEEDSDQFYGGWEGGDDDDEEEDNGIPDEVLEELAAKQRREAEAVQAAVKAAQAVVQAERAAQAAAAEAAQAAAAEAAQAEAAEAEQAAAPESEKESGIANGAPEDVLQIEEGGYFLEGGEDLEEDTPVEEPASKVAKIDDGMLR